MALGCSLSGASFVRPKYSIFTYTPALCDVFDVVVLLSKPVFYYLIPYPLHIYTSVHIPIKLTAR